jgi:Arc/MetJ-type ribon-helix-helix transcriptional regulator
MDLKARQKKKQAPQELASSAKTISEETYSESISLQFNTLLYTTLQNMIEGSLAANDFTYTSVADVIRAALVAYQGGMELTELEQPGEKRNISLRLTKQQQEFYQSWPKRMRRRLLERAVRSFLRNL